jgi:hypothetical protein
LIHLELRLETGEGEVEKGKHRKRYNDYGFKYLSIQTKRLSLGQQFFALDRTAW